jgi:hypothetical protein
MLILLIHKHGSDVFDFFLQWFIVLIKKAFGFFHLTYSNVFYCFWGYGNGIVSLISFLLCCWYTVRLLIMYVDLVSYYFTERIYEIS